MKKLIKFILILVASLIALGVAAVFLVPMFVDVQKYKPVIEEKITAATGFPVTLDGDLQISVFPWVGVSLSGLQLGNPEGFSSQSFVTVGSFEAHVKVMPLLSRQIEVDSIVIDSPEIVLEKKKNGEVNWQRIGTGPQQEKTTAKPTPSESKVLPLDSVQVGVVAIKNGKITYIDQGQNIKKNISDLNLELTNISFVTPVSLDFSARIDNKPVSLAGEFGPLGKNIGKEPIAFTFTFNGFEQVTARLNGQISDPAGSLSYLVNLEVDQFSPRKLLETAGVEFPIATSNPEALGKISLKTAISGTHSSLTLKNGQLNIDKSKMDFSGKVNAFSPINLQFEGNMDAIDLNDYLPPAASETDATAKKQPEKETKSIDYAPLRALLLDTKLTVGDIKIQGGSVQNMVLHLIAKNGVFTFKPFKMDMYQGNFDSTITANLKGQKPATTLNVKTTGVQVGPLLQDFAKKDFLEGALDANANIMFRGDSSEAMKKSLNGKGQLLFTDGALVGVDIAGMVRNVKASFGLAERTTTKPRTDFAELRVPFTLKNGLFNTPGTTMASPLLRVDAKGTAHLVTEKLDMKVKPKFVASLKGQGDTVERSGLMVPVLVSGTFTSPQFTPDLTGILEGGLPDTKTLKKAIEGELSPEKIIPKEQIEAIEKGLKGLFN